MTPLAQLAPPAAASTAHLTRKQKAAIVVRYLLNEGAEIPLTDLPEPLQASLTTQMGSMRYVDRSTLADVVAEFAGELEALGLTFPRGVVSALSVMEGKISPQTAARLRKEAGVRQFGDPWELVCQIEVERLLPIMEQESIEVAAVVLSKLDVSRAADLLGRLPGPKARRITYAVSQTGDVTPEAVDRIGLSLASQLHEVPETAFASGPVERVGAILNFSPAATRDDVLTGLDERDQEFATRVRKAIFTFENVKDRVNKTDVPKLMRDVEQSVMVTALAAAMAAGEDVAPSAEFLLENMSKRMADAMREEIQERGKIKAKDGEEAMTDVVNSIRKLEASGDLILVAPEEEGE